MLQRKNIVSMFLGAALAMAPAAAQEGYKSEASAQAFGSFVKDTVNDGIRQSATNSGGVLGTYRYFFTGHHGVEANYGYSRNTQSYFLSGGPVGLSANQHEITAAYVLHWKCCSCGSGNVAP